MRKAALWFVICLMTINASSAWGQEEKKVPPPPKPANEGPSLEVTMKFIQDKLSDIQKVSYVLYTHNELTGQDATSKIVREITDVKVEAKSCHIRSHWKSSQDQEIVEDADFGFDLKDVQSISVMPEEQYAKKLVTAAGRPELSSRFDPPLFVVEIVKPNHQANYFVFFDEELANRVAKAMVHAVELCGGGSKEPF